MKNKYLSISIGIIALILIEMCVYTVDVKEQAVTLQFGKPVSVVKDPGIHTKLPYPFQTVTFYDDRLLEYDASPEEILTEDKKTLVVNNYARWRIADPLKFMQAVRDEHGAQARLDDIIYSELRVELGKFTLQSIISALRDSIMFTVSQRCNEKAQEYGIEVVDVRTIRADLPEQNEKAVFDRMSSERLRMATLHRSGGEQEALKIRAQTLKDSTIMMANAYKIAQKNRGEGDGQAITIYAAAFEKDPQFFAFTRSLEAYKKTLKNKTTIVVGTESEFFKYLEGLKK